MIEIFKHIHKYDKYIITQKFQLRTRPSRKHGYQIQPIIPKDGVRGLQHNSFYYRNTETWNNLPRKVVDAKDVNSLKNNLDEAWRDIQTKYEPRAGLS